MSNVNTFAGYQDLPAQVISTAATPTALLVPATGYSTLPSPALPAGVGLYVGVEQDVTSGGTFDANKFVVRVQGKLFTGAASTFTMGLYQVPAAIAAAGTQSTAANDPILLNMTAASAAITGASNFVFEAELLWDSTSNLLVGYANAVLVNGILQVVNTATAGTIGVSTPRTLTGAADLKFIPFFSFGTANAANSVTVTEFAIDRA